MTKLQSEVQSMRDGVAKVLPTSSSLLVDGAMTTQADLLKLLDGYLATFAAEAEGKMQYAKAHAVLVTDTPEMRQKLLDLATTLRTQFGKGSPQLVGFGLAAKGKSRTPSQETKTIAVAKRAATRKARGTLGKVQKLAVTAVPGPKLQVLQPVVVLPVAQVSVPVAPTPNPAPAAK